MSDDNTGKTGAGSSGSGHAGGPSIGVKSGSGSVVGEVGPGVEKGAGGEMPFKPDELLREGSARQRGEGQGDPLDGGCS